MIRAFVYVSLVLGILSLTLSAVSLFSIKHRVKDMKRQLHMLERNIILEKESIHVLEAEWAYLTQPKNVSKMATMHLKLIPLEPSKVIKLEPNKEIK